MYHQNFCGILQNTFLIKIKFFLAKVKFTKRVKIYKKKNKYKKIYKKSSSCSFVLTNYTLMQNKFRQHVIKYKKKEPSQ